MVNTIKRSIAPPKRSFNYPVYLRTANNRYYIKVKSSTEATWLEFVDSEKFKVWCTGFDQCGEGEFFDVEFMVAFCNSMTEKEYLARLKAFTSHFEFIKTSLNL